MTGSSPFASRTLCVHLIRGAVALGLVGVGLWALATPNLLTGFLALAALIGAVILLRGCPMCWLVGLAATIAAARKKGRAGEA